MGLRNNEDFAMSHLLFADDTLIFVGPIVNYSAICVVSFYVSEVVSGLKINLSKSKIILVSEVVDVDHLA